MFSGEYLRFCRENCRLRRPSGGPTAGCATPASDLSGDNSVSCRWEFTLEFEAKDVDIHPHWSPSHFDNILRPSFTKLVTKSQTKAKPKPAQPSRIQPTQLEEKLS